MKIPGKRIPEAGERIQQLNAQVLEKSPSTAVLWEGWGWVLRGPPSMVQDGGCDSAECHLAEDTSCPFGSPTLASAGSAIHSARGWRLRHPVLASGVEELTVGWLGPV